MPRSHRSPYLERELLQKIQRCTRTPKKKANFGDSYVRMRVFIFVQCMPRHTRSVLFPIRVSDSPTHQLIASRSPSATVVLLLIQDFLKGVLSQSARENVRSHAHFGLKPRPFSIVWGETACSTSPIDLLKHTKVSHSSSFLTFVPGGFHLAYDQYFFNSSGSRPKGVLSKPSNPAGSATASAGQVEIA